MFASSEGVTLSIGSMLSVLLNIGTVFVRPLQAAALLAAVLLVLRLWKSGLTTSYWAVCGLLVVKTVADLLITLDGRNGSIYQEASATLTVLLATFVFWDLSRRVFRNYPSLAEFATRSSKYILPACVLLGVLSFTTDPETPAGRSPHLHLVIAVQRAMTSALLAYLLVTAGFAGWFPVRMTRNVARLLVGFLVLFGTTWFTTLMNNAAPRAIWWANAADALVILIICSYWLVTLNAAGEEVVAATVPQWNPERLRDLTQQLDQMQAQLSRRGF